MHLRIQFLDGHSRVERPILLLLRRARLGRSRTPHRPRNIGLVVDTTDLDTHPRNSTASRYPDLCSL